jgi:hypothetical protein
MGKKLHIICGKCGSDEVNFVLSRQCPDDPMNLVHIVCSNCRELTGIAEWSEFNGRELIDRREAYSGRTAQDRLNWVLIQQPTLEDGYLRIWLGNIAAAELGLQDGAGYYIATGATRDEQIDNAMDGKLEFVE